MRDEFPAGWLYAIYTRQGIAGHNSVAGDCETVPVRDEGGEIEEVNSGIASLRGHAVLQLAAPQTHRHVTARAIRVLRLCPHFQDLIIILSTDSNCEVLHVQQSCKHSHTFRNCSLSFKAFYADHIPRASKLVLFQRTNTQPSTRE